jgi:hypothetical protein
MLPTPPMLRPQGAGVTVGWRCVCQRAGADALALQVLVAEFLVGLVRVELGRGQQIMLRSRSTR